VLGRSATSSAPPVETIVSDALRRALRVLLRTAGEAQAAPAYLFAELLSASPR
jgi:hypothetical protein